MTTINRSLALVVEGMGSDASYSGGIAWYYGRSTIGTPGDYEWVGGRGSGAGLVEPPQTVGSTVDPWEMQIQGSAQSFRLHATDAAKALWLHRPTRPKDTLNAEITETAQSITFTGNASWSSADDGSVVWIGDEAIYLVEHQAGSTFTCTRGHWGTTAMLQPAKMNVWDYNPRRVNRLARILIYDHDAGTTTQAWQGFVDSISIDGPVIHVSCSDLITAIRGSKVNRNAVALNTRTNADVRKASQTAIGAVLMPAGTEWRQRVNKSGATSPHWVAIQGAGAAWFAKWTDGSTPDAASFIDVNSSTSAPILGSTAVVEDTVRAPMRDLGPVHELLVVDRKRDLSAGVLDPTYANVRSSTRDLLRPHHPIAITMALWTSGYDTTPGVQGSGDTGAPLLPSSVGYAWEADSGLGLADGAAVATWEPVAGAVDLVQPLSANKPTYRASAATSGRPSIEFDTTSAYKLLSSDTALGTLAQPNTIILVAEFVDTSTFQAFYDSEDSGGRNHLWLNTGPVFQLYAGANVNPGFTPDTDLHMYAAAFNGASSFLRVDGTKGSAVNPGTQGLDDIHLGANFQTPTAGSRMYVHGFYVVDGLLSDDDLDDMQTYCQYKWGSP